jgi:hypothetical protein
MADDKVAATDEIRIVHGRRTPSGKLLPEGLWPCKCHVCHELMPLYRAVEHEAGAVIPRHLGLAPGDPRAGEGLEMRGPSIEVFYSGCGCGNEQRTILGSEDCPDERPRFPCPACGRESTAHAGPRGTMICAMPLCRTVWTRKDD